ncbi:hypothetical protein TIFTF001_020608 [Ficus carica]|uniref:Uncharacterized protein n=1 Tax=Ficus carica TaxID=3494 RepID=A0AA88AF88_FICCA|nr:hypothetical protein TIFTF001_020608 [Ficus carica]
MKKNYRGWKALQVRTGLGYDPSTERVHKECNHLRHEGLRNKELYYNIFEKNHAAGASGFGSVTMRDGSTPYVEPEFSMDNSGIHPILEEELTPTNGGRQGNTRRAGDDAGPSRRSQSGAINEQSSRPDHLLMCMNIMTEMGIPLDHRTIMWHNFEAHPLVQRTFHQLPNDDRRGIIASVVKSQSPPAD